MKAAASSPKILVVFNGKGGVGKTTTAVNLAAAFAQQNGRQAKGEKPEREKPEREKPERKSTILLVDADPQGSATWWAERGEAMNFDVTQETNPPLLGKLRTIEGYSLIVVDTPPALKSEAIAAIIPSADYLILPTPPAPMDLSALIDTVKQIVIPSGVAHRVLLTRVDPRSLGEALEAQNTLLEMGIPACHAFIRAYKAHERAALEGLSILDWKGKNGREAEADYRRVAEEIGRDWQ